MWMHTGRARLVRRSIPRRCVSPPTLLYDREQVLARRSADVTDSRCLCCLPTARGAVWSCVRAGLTSYEWVRGAVWF